MAVGHKPPNEKQTKYLEGLFEACGFTRISRNAWLTREVNREIRFIEDISSFEVSHCIDRLKEIKGDRVPPVTSEDWDGIW